MISDEKNVRQAYHVAVRIGEDRIHVSALIGDFARRGLPTTILNFQPVQSDPATYPITIYWKSVCSEDPIRQAAVEHAVVDYCRQLFHESAYQGPVDCCL